MRRSFLRRLTGLVLAASSLACGGGSAPSPESVGTAPDRARAVWDTGTYRNLFTELGGHSQADVDAKLEAMKQQFFLGDDDQRFYYEGGPGAYILAKNGSSDPAAGQDVRSEGMSYGMMVAVQLDMRAEFDKLWAWTKANMLHTSGDWKGYFAWQCRPDGTRIDETSAPDGEEWLATALFFAWQRWGDEAYKRDADAILDAMLHQGERADPSSGVTNVFIDHDGKKLVTFGPCHAAGLCEAGGDAAAFTDPSYHLPGFYELWARWAAKDNAVWKKIAQDSRAFLATAVHPSTGLGPDYANYDGTPDDGSSWNGESNHDRFAADAWRTAMNIAVDQYWWGTNAPWAVEHADTVQGFFQGLGLSEYPCTMSVDGATVFNPGHAAGLVGANAVVSLTASDAARATAFVEELWNQPMPTGDWRYYDGLLHVLGMLHVSGNFKIWGAGTYAVNVSKVGTGAGRVILAGGTGIDCGDDCTQAYAAGSEVKLVATPEDGSSFAGWTVVGSGDTCAAGFPGECQFKVNEQTTVQAWFTKLPTHRLDVSLTGSGTGRVFSASPGIDCSASSTDCSEDYPYGTWVALTAVADGGSNFAGWDGKCSIMKEACLIKVTEASTVKAVFNSGALKMVITPVVAQNDAYFTEQRVRIDNPMPVTAMSLTIKVKKTPGVSYNSQYNTVGGPIRHGHSETSSTITYTFEVISGQAIPAGSGRIFAAQMNGTGTVHPTSGDTYTLSYTMGGVAYTKSGTF